jgi:uncharacterized Tic20 family protein
VPRLTCRRNLGCTRDAGSRRGYSVSGEAAKDQPLCWRRAGNSGKLEEIRISTVAERIAEEHPKGRSTVSVDEELDKLQKLRDAGTITDEQYERARAKLLDENPEAPVEASVAEPRAARADAPEGDRDERRPRRRARARDELDDYDDRDRRPKKVREWSMILHLSLFAGHVIPFGGILAPIIIWQTQKEEMPELDRHGKNAVNWVLTFVISLCAFIPLSFLFVGIPFLIAACVMNVVFPIMAAVKAYEGKVWRYPLSITFFK